MIEIKKTSRGFSFGKFTDLYGVECSIQESPSADDVAIWLGCDELDPKVLLSDAKILGIQTDDTIGWVSYPLPPAVHINTRMHLNQEQVAELLPILQKFVETGEI